MNTETQNQVIAFKYIVKDADTHEVYENTYGLKPTEFITGFNQIIPALEKELLNVTLGKEQKIYLEYPYGHYDENAIQKVPRYQLGDLVLEKGMPLYAKNNQGQTIQVSIVDFDNKIVHIDHNHPMAGKNLIFKVKVVNKRPATPEELTHGHTHADDHSCGCGSGCGCH